MTPFPRPVLPAVAGCFQPLVLLLRAAVLTAALAGRAPAQPAAATGPLATPQANPDFWAEQLRYPRVRAAYGRLWPALAADLTRRGLNPLHFELFFRLIKTTEFLEVWARPPGEGRFAQLRAYPLAATSGTLGPKRRRGDRQVPEGFYYLDRFNPASKYHLSLGINYPNLSDLAGSGPLVDPGGDIFIHGANVTEGCLPLTDAGIEEVYLLAVAARAGGQAQIPVHLFPFPLTAAELAQRQQSPYAAFWQSLAPGYRYFKAHRQLAAE